MNSLSSQNSSNIGNKKGMTPRSLINFMITTCFTRMKNINFEKLDSMKEPFKKMLDNESKRHQGEEQKYAELMKIVDSFFEYIKDPKVLNRIASKELSRRDLEEMVLKDVLNMDKRKYDMRDLYRRDLISVSREDPSKRNVNILTRPPHKCPKHEYTNSEGKMVLINDLGSVQYEEWGGVKASLPVYLIRKEQDDGSFSSKIVTSLIIISDMDDPEYRSAVLEELLSDENINKSNVGSYIGRIEKRRKQDPKDLPHTERQDLDEYTYRIDDNYVLKYDATELTAVIEGIRNNYDRLKRIRSTRIDDNSSNPGNRKNTGFDDFDSPGGR